MKWVVLFLVMNVFSLDGSFMELVAEPQDEDENEIPYLVMITSSMIGALVFAGVTVYFLKRNDRKNRNDGE
ncbi:hypothetical protein [Geomicrobium sp. JCM 19039]|uniref:hypothetical protein n=1 Tax=Geomicrobium sp. JCM 19039 TaxID=1460636 RepID=UPI00045F3745|nr:hypothetical protein [Geomicrobium sp. JCM 19039]GAK11766.1 hypothetical protein JCM19039_1481 [Geomicrobium sp. JCM 19039]